MDTEKGSVMKKSRWALGFLMLALILCLVSLMAACGGEETTTTAAPATTAAPTETTATPATTAAPTETTAAPTETTAAASDEVIELRYASPFLVEEAPTAGAYIFMDYVEEHSNGRVHFDRYPAAQLGTMIEMMELMTTGAVDMATTIHNLFPEQLPLNVGVTNNFQNSSRFAVEFGNELQFDIPETSKLLQDEWTANNIKFFTYTASGQLALMTKKAINSISEMAGVKINVPSNIRIAAWTNLGLVPTVLNTTDVYEAFARGQVDAIDHTLGAMVSNKWYESGTNCYPYGLFPASAPVMMNLESYNKLPADIQQIFLDAAKATAEATIATAEELDAGYVKEMTDAGIEMGTLSQADLDLIYTNFMTQWEADAMANAEAQNVVPEMETIWSTVHEKLGK